MSTEHPEFPPLETAPSRRTWPWAVAGAALVIALVWALRRPQATAEVRAQPLSNVAAVVPAAKPPPAEAAKTSAAQVKAPESPNVLGSAVAAAKSVATVAKAELDRELARTRSAQTQAAGYRKQIEELQKELGAARAQIAAMQTAQKPPPPTDQEQILQTLAPVLRAGNGGQP
jgi:type IV secretory pathway VirB10-like protein